jgi:serine/threonine-protein kinase
VSASCPRCGFTASGPGLAVCPSCLLDGGGADGGDLPAAPPGLTLEGEIGRGAMGRVFRARHLRLDRLVAVKFLPPDLAADPAFEARFAREARAMARLAHPNVVSVHDFGTTEAGESFLVMELVPGGTLAARIPLSPGQAVEAALDVCDGLAYAHEQGLVHRDIKPENVLFDARGRAKIGDFGIARLLDPDAPAGPPLTRPSLVLGTPGYMAPEARAGAPPDARMDVYAVGALVHEMITGRLPGHAAAGGPALPPALAPVVRRALAPEPADRWPSVAALRDALAAASEQVRAPADAASSLPPEEQSWQRAVALALAGATALALYALLASITPRVLDPTEAVPLISTGAEARPDGRLFTRARFETWPTLAAVVAFAVALGAYGLLRRHWRHAGLDAPSPERPVAAVRAVVKVALVIDALFFVRLGIQRAGAHSVATYVPVAGGVLELIMVYAAWLAALEARRTSRPLHREPWLWVAIGLALVPPAVSVLRILAGGAP